MHLSLDGFAAGPNATIIRDHLADEIAAIKQGAGSGILAFGSPTATHSLMRQQLIDGFWLFVNPVILGQGIPLFTDVRDRVKLQLSTTRPFSSGVTELNYIVDRPDSEPGLNLLPTKK